MLKNNLELSLPALAFILLGGVSGGGTGLEGLLVEAEGVTGTTGPDLSNIEFDLESLLFLFVEGGAEILFLLVEGGAGVEGVAEGQFCYVYKGTLL